ncbi:hypothetical protein HK102_012076 [Quaeritorhiza haematococci]|nr:hypothetical protein HK102_012076 [Quaeritorhiza haematococci]
MERVDGGGGSGVEEEDDDDESVVVVVDEAFSFDFDDDEGDISTVVLVSGHLLNSCYATAVSSSTYSVDHPSFPPSSVVSVDGNIDDDSVEAAYTYTGVQAVSVKT